VKENSLTAEEAKRHAIVIVNTSAFIADQMCINEGRIRNGKVWTKYFSMWINHAHYESLNKVKAEIAKRSALDKS